MRRYHVTTYGCQMNAHDSERIKGMLEDLGYGEAAEQADADVIVFNTCTIRDKPDQRLYKQLEQVRHLKRADDSRVIAVGGCLVEAQQNVLFNEFPWVDVAFGPGRIEALGEHLITAGGGSAAGYYGIADERTFAADLPHRRERGHAAWLQISMGCNSKCAYCIVPSVRGREKSRPTSHIVREAEMLALDGVRELTLLGQNVNSYGRDLPLAERVTFAELLREVDAIDGIDRIRFTSPHPKDMREDVIAAMAECAAVCEQLHLPLQSGSSRILKAMRRTYNRERYLALVERIRAAIPDIALSTDIIVGFPGETDDDFAETLEVVREVEYDSAFTFIYSPRAGTEAAVMADQVPSEVQHERLDELVRVVREIAVRRNERHVGEIRDVLIEGPARRGDNMMLGRTRHNVKVIVPGEHAVGSIIDVRISGATSETLSGEPVAVAIAK